LRPHSIDDAQIIAGCPVSTGSRSDLVHPLSIYSPVTSVFGTTVETGTPPLNCGNALGNTYQHGHARLVKVRVDYVLGAKWLLRVRLLADRTWALRRLPGNKHRRLRVGDVLLLAEQRDRRQGGTSTIRCALRELADRT
jgi:hypothetical protein